jgi:ABC-2 type transport system permease protein
MNGIFLFEINYRKNRPATYIYFAIIFFSCILTIASPAKRAVGFISPNAPYLMTFWTLTMSFVFFMITSAIMGVSVVRDFDHNMEEILFSHPLKKSQYLFGRFFGSFVTLVLINCGVWMGLIIGLYVSEFVPWNVAWRGQPILPFNAWHYFQPFFLFTIPNLFVTGALFFMSGALGRNSLIIYTQGIFLLVLYQIGSTLLGDIESRQLAALIDPLGIHTFRYVTQYWTPQEQNTMLVPLQGLVLYNRVLWVGIGVIALVITYYGFSFRTVRNSLSLKKPASDLGEEKQPVTDDSSREAYVLDPKASFSQIFRMAFFYFKMIWKEIPFLAVVAGGLLLLVVNAFNMTSMYGGSSHPTTYSILNLMNTFTLSFLVIAIFYTGELLWKEKSMNIHLMIDALPTPTFATLVAKFLSMALIYISLLMLLIVAGVITQAAYGNYSFDLPVYFGTLFTSTFSFLLLYTLITIFIQVLVRNKFVGFALTIVFFIVESMLSQIGVEHSLWRFASGTLGVFSDMNQYGHFIIPFAWNRIYWLAFASVLFAVAILFVNRGVEENVRWNRVWWKSRVTRPLVIFSLLAISVFVTSGLFIYYNTTVLNRFENEREQQEKHSNYEKTLGKFQSLPQPKIVEANLNVELYPSTRDFTASGYYYLKNNSGDPIKNIHVQNPSSVTMDELRFSRETVLKKDFQNFRYVIYELAQPLLPGDSVRMDFKETYFTRGFKDTQNDTDVIYNGTFFTNAYFPHIGYNRDMELTEEQARKKHQLKSKEQMMMPNSALARHANVFGSDADHIRFEIVVGTEADQTAIAPGYLQKKWKSNNRNFFHYKVSEPMANFYAVISANYHVMTDKWKDVDLEVYYHPGHEYNLRKMIDAMKASLSYYEENFGPYQYTQLRIIEFPRYNTYAQSFANTIPFSEGMGFILKVKNPDKDLDVAFYVTAHEVAHQWWGHQVMQADARGSGMLSESMAQYSALMVMKHRLPTEAIQRYLKYELDAYLSGRATETRKELPLRLAESQSYIHYNKASLVFYALQDYIGEENVNRAFQKYLEKWSFKQSPYPTSDDLLDILHEVTPDSLQYLLTDMFETITLFENKTQKAMYEESPGGGYEVTLSVSSEKIRVDTLGNERQIPMGDWVDIGIYSKDANGHDRLVYRKKHRIDKRENIFVINVKDKPSKAGIDPLDLLIDRHSEDNTLEVRHALPIGNALPF